MATMVRWKLPTIFLAVLFMWCVAANIFFYHRVQQTIHNDDIMDLYKVELNMGISLSQPNISYEQSLIPNFPLQFWSDNIKKPMYYNKSCARFPNLNNLRFSNVYWQDLETSLGSAYLYGAYYDTRKQNGTVPSVRVLGMFAPNVSQVSLVCQLWFQAETQPVFSNVTESTLIWVSKLGIGAGYTSEPRLLTCDIPDKYKNRVPDAVSIVTRVCHVSSNLLGVVYNKPADGVKKGFAVCVKGLNFPHYDISVRLIEWIELLTLLGAHKVFFYNLQSHSNIIKVLRYYEELQIVHVTPLTLPRPQPNFPWLQHIYLDTNPKQKRYDELIPYNDCLYRNMYLYQYMVLLDVDEIIVPKQVDTWRKLLDNYEKKAREVKKPKDSYQARQVYFFDDYLHSHGYFEQIPPYMYMLQHVHRSHNHSEPGLHVKSFLDTNRVVTVHNHVVLTCLDRACSTLDMEPAIAQLQHYRSDCVDSLLPVCQAYRNNSFQDTTLWRYKDTLINRTTLTFQTRVLPHTAHTVTIPTASRTQQCGDTRTPSTTEPRSPFRDSGTSTHCPHSDYCHNTQDPTVVIHCCP